MIKSKFMKYLKIDNNVYAVFNILIMDVIYVNKKDFDNILKLNFNEMSDSFINKLCNSGILVKNSSYDDRAYNLMNNFYLNDSKKIDILYLIITQGCNLGCKYCFLENPTGNWKNLTMNFNTAQVAVDKFVQYVRSENIKDATIMLFGGEPLINWKLIKQIVEYSHNKYPDMFESTNLSDNISFRMVTNGTLIDEEKAVFMKKYNIVAAISLDGPKKINDINRVFKGGNQSVYDSVLKSIDILRKNNCDFGLSITLSPAVINDKEYIIQWLKKIDIKNIYFNPLHYSQKNKDWKDHYKKSTQFMIDIFDELTIDKIINGRITRQIDSFVKRMFYFADCGAAGLHQFVVKPNGDVLVCQCDYDSEYNCLGNIKTDSFQQLLSNPKTERWVNAIPLKKNKCLKCKGLFICGGSCLTQNTNMFGRSCQVDQTYCIYIKMILEWLLKRWYIEKGGLLNAKDN